LGADLHTARKGIVLPVFFKNYSCPLSLCSRYAAFVLHQHGLLQTTNDDHSKNGEVVSDNAYSAAILGYLPNGLIGLSLAALTAAIVCIACSKANSISTIFTLDIYKKYIGRKQQNKRWFGSGAVTILAALFVLSC